MRIVLYSCGSCGYRFQLPACVVARMSITGMTELRRISHVAHMDECPGVHYCEVHPTFVVLPNATEGLRPWCTAGHVANLPTVRDIPAEDRIGALLREVPC